MPATIYDFVSLVVKVPLFRDKVSLKQEKGTELQGVCRRVITVCVRPNNRLRIPEQPFAYTQTLLLNFLEGHPGGTQGAHF